MSIFNVFSIAASALTAQSQRLNTVASNLANADSATSSTGEPYRAKQVIFATTPVQGDGGQGVKVTAVVNDPSPMRKVYEPHHPLADKEGYVTFPNVNAVEEMVNMISASRAYQDNADVMNTAKAMLLKTLTIGE